MDHYDSVSQNAILWLLLPQLEVDAHGIGIGRAQEGTEDKMDVIYF